MYYWKMVLIALCKINIFIVLRKLHVSFVPHTVFGMYTSAHSNVYLNVCVCVCALNLNEILIEHTFGFGLTIIIISDCCTVGANINDTVVLASWKIKICCDDNQFNIQTIQMTHVLDAIIIFIYYIPRENCTKWCKMLIAIVWAAQKNVERTLRFNNKHSISSITLRCNGFLMANLATFTSLTSLRPNSSATFWRITDY